MPKLMPAALPHGSAPTLGLRSKALLRILLWLVTLFGTGITVLNQVSDPHGQGAFGYVGPLVAVMALILFYRQRERHAVMVFVWGMAFYLTVGSVMIAGVRTPAIVGLVVIVTFAGWLISPRHGYLMALLSALFVLALGTAQHFGFVHYDHLRPPLNTGLLLAIYIMLSAVFSIITGTEIREEIQRNAKLSEDLSQELTEHKKSEQRFAALFRSNPLPSQIGTPDGTILDVNQIWLDTFGLTRDQTIGKRTIDLELALEPELLQELGPLLRETGAISNRVMRFRTVNGDRQFLLNAAIIESGGDPIYVASLIDLTDRLAAEAAQREMNQQLEQRVVERTAELSNAFATLRQTQNELVQAEKLASLGSLVAGISHELNTPIGNAVTVVSTLRSSVHKFRETLASGLKRSSLDGFVDHVDEASSLIERSTMRAGELIGSFKQVAVDQTSERRRVFALDELVADIMATVRPGLKRTPWQFAIDVPTGISCDSYPGPLGQIITNLVQNAALHAFEGRETGTIRVTATLDPAHDMVTLEISDDGIGMSAATRARAFDPFFTTKLGKGGSGLGLSICHRLATSVLGGALDLEALHEGGTRLVLRFPRIAGGRI